MNEIVKRLRAALVDVGSDLTDTDIQNIQELIDANEPGVAFENLCTQLQQYSVKCRSNQVLELASIGTSMGIDPKYWRQIEVLAQVNR